jgi:hypothetical protein
MRPRLGYNESALLLREIGHCEAKSDTFSLVCASQEEEDAAGAAAAVPGVQQQGAAAGQFVAGPATPYPDMSAYGTLPQGTAGMQNPQQQIPGMQLQQQQPMGYAAGAAVAGGVAPGGLGIGAAVGGMGSGAYGGSLLGGGGSLQQRGTGLLDIDDEDDFGFFDDPLAPLDNIGMMAGAGGLGGVGGSAAAAAAPRGLGVGMSLDGTTTGLNLLQHAAGGSGNPYGAADAGAADYSYWVARGNVEAAATDPRRARAAAAAAGRGAGLTGALGPMWGGQKPPPGMDTIGLGSRQQQQQQRDHGERDMRDNGPPSGRVSALDRLHSPPGEPPNRGAGRDRSPDRGPRQKSSPFNMDMRPLRERPGYSSRSPPRRRSEDGRRRSSPGGRGPAVARPASRSPPRGPSRNRSRSPPTGTRGAGESDRRGRGASPPPGRAAAAAAAAAPGGRSNSRQGRSASPVRGRDTRGRDPRYARDPRDARDARGPRDGSPAGDNNNKRRRDASTGLRGEPGSPVGGKKRSRWGPEQQDTRSAPPRDSKRAGPDADAGRAGGQFPGPPAGGDLEAVARRFDGRLEGAEGIFGELQLEKDVKSWLRELAEYAGRPPRPLEQPTPIKLGTLAKQLPLPHNVLSR